MKRIFVLVFLLSAMVMGQDILRKTSKVSSDLFGTESMPINIGIIPSNPSDSILAETLFNALIKQENITNKFAISSYSELLDTKIKLKLKSISFNDQSSLSTLFNILKIKYVMSLSPIDKSLRLEIKNTLNGNIIYTNDYLNSDSSTAIEDLLMLFSDEIKVTYIQQGTLEVRVKNKNALLKIDNIEKPLPYNEKLLPARYRLEISSEGYQTLYESIDIGAGQTVSKNYKLEEAFGSCKIEVSPLEVHTKFIRKRDSVLVAEYVGEIRENHIQEGLYYLEFSALGFTPLHSYSFRIKADSTVSDKINLFRSFFVITKFMSNGVPEPIWDVKIIPGEKIYKIIYSLAGEPDDTYDINVWMVRKDNDDISTFPLKGLSGELGEDIPAGSEKIIEWDVEKDFPNNNIQSNNYSFYIEVD